MWADVLERDEGTGVSGVWWVVISKGFTVCGCLLFGVGVRSRVVGLKEVVLVFVEIYSAVSVSSFRWRLSCNGWLDELSLALSSCCGDV